MTRAQTIAAFTTLIGFVLVLVELAEMMARPPLSTTKRASVEIATPKFDPSSVMSINDVFDIRANPTEESIEEEPTAPTAVEEEPTASIVGIGRHRS